MSKPINEAVPPRPPNRLQAETSPYLRQHMHNPVDWLPWGREAFALARESDRPILLSIGYSACHWCHVMAHESFDDDETAAQMNRDFVNIKVDREEHPDVDQLYQHALQIFGQNGGWPLTMFLLPTGEPFYGGTYFPPREAYGRPSFRRVLAAVKEAFLQDRQRLSSQAEKVREALQELEGRGAGSASSASEPAESGGGLAALGQVGPGILAQACAHLAKRVDRSEGGFVGAPKFPNPTALSLFLRSYGRTGEPEEAKPALLTLAKMAAGGIYDHLGGGFARYSTDAVWLVPHFEKMLYDNAQLLRLYAEAHHIHSAAGEVDAAARCAQVISETHGWLEREMSDPAGGLYAAQDADSEGVEGKYFLWTPEQLEAALPEARARLFARCYDVRPGGNFRDPHGHAPPGSSVLHLLEQPAEPEQLAELAAARAQLFAARQGRIPPGTDDKVLCGWNGLTITGLAEAGRLLDRAPLLATARRVADFIWSAMYRGGADAKEEVRLRRTYKQGVAKLPATLDDHAFFAEGLIHLAYATQDLTYLRRALTLTEDLLHHFYDDERGLFYLGPEESEGVRLPIRPVSYYDSAIPSGLSVACLNLLRLAGLFAGPAGLQIDDVRRRYQRIAERMLGQLIEPAGRSPFGLANVCAALDLLGNGLSVTVIVDPDLQPDMELGRGGRALRQAANAVYVPEHAVLICHPERALPGGLDHHRQGKSAQDGKATAYVCQGPVCSAPIVDPEALRRKLCAPRSSG